MSGRRAPPTRLVAELQRRQTRAGAPSRGLDERECTLVGRLHRHAKSHPAALVLAAQPGLAPPDRAEAVRVDHRLQCRAAKADRIGRGQPRRLGARGVGTGRRAVRRLQHRGRQQLREPSVALPVHVAAVAQAHELVHRKVGLPAREGLVHGVPQVDDRDAVPPRDPLQGKHLRPRVRGTVSET